MYHIIKQIGTLRCTKHYTNTTLNKVSRFLLKSGTKQDSKQFIKQLKQVRYRYRMSHQATDHLKFTVIFVFQQTDPVEPTTRMWYNIIFQSREIHHEKV